LGYTWSEHANNCAIGLPGLTNGRLGIIARPKIVAALLTIVPTLGDIIVALHQPNSSVEPAGNWVWTDTRIANSEYPMFTSLIEWTDGDPNVRVCVWNTLNTNNMDISCVYFVGLCG
jgi:hypothetical protein